MAKYSATKTLRKAIPTVRTQDGVVKSWEIEVLYSYTNTADETWSRSYPHREENLEYLNKTPEQFTKAELVALMPDVMDAVFDSHYETFNTPPTTERVAEFNLNNLA